MTGVADLIRFDRVDSVEPSERGLIAHLHGERLSIDVVRGDVVRLRMSRAGVFEESPTHAVCGDPMAQPVEIALEWGAGVVRVRAEGLVVSLWLDPFRLDVHRPDGSPVIESAQDEEGNWWGFATLNDAFAVRRRCSPGDSIYGLGEKTGPQDRRGWGFTLWNTDVLDPRASGQFASVLDPDDPRADNTSTLFDPYYVSIPLFHHQDASTGACAGSFVDNAHRAHYDFTATVEYRFGFDGGQYTEYVFAGPRLPEVVSAYTALTGRMALPPIWSLGYHQCRWYPYAQQDVERIAARHRQSGIPCDSLWLDIDYMDGYRVFTWDPSKFPDPAGMLERLAAKGFRVITIIDPGVKFDPGYRVFDQAVERDVLCRTEGGGIYLGQVWPGLTAFPDFATEEARDWWGELNAAHVRSGVAGIWNDMNEPATGSIDPGSMLFDRGRASHRRYHNQYALLMAMGTVAGLREAMPDQRTFVLSRAGSAGIQRYAANWLGDNMSNWDHLRLSIQMANGLGLSGQPFVGADIGGFMGNTDAELLTRWTQYAALTPFCRNHAAAGSPDQYAWAFGSEVEDRIREALRLRYRLLPYIYAAFVVASETGAPVQRQLVFDHQYDTSLRGIDDQYLFGPDLLVAPVTQPGVTSRPVRLPPGEWYDWHTDELVQGREVVAAAPPDRIPVYARGGAVIPMWAQAPASTAGHHPSVVELHIFVPRADRSHRSLLQEDDGLTLAAHAGARIRTTIDLVRAGRMVRVDAVVEGNGYPLFAREAFDIVLHGAHPRAVKADGVLLHITNGRVRLRNSGQGFSLEFLDD